MAEIEALGPRWGPAIWAGYNSIRFDEEFLRHSNYCALRQPYMTQLNGNSRGDVVRLAQLATAIEPGALRVPIIRGKSSFKLGPLAAANGFTGHAAHDALGDVRATVQLLRIIRSQAPGAWALFSALVSKTRVIETLLGAEFAVVILHFGVAVAKPVLPICANPDYPAQWLTIDLSRDPSPLLAMDPPALATTLAVPRSPLCRIKTTACRWSSRPPTLRRSVSSLPMSCRMCRDMHTGCAPTAGSPAVLSRRRGWPNGRIRRGSISRSASTRTAFSLPRPTNTASSLLTKRRPPRNLRSCSR